MKENKFTMWVKSHKTELVVAGSVVLTALGVIFLSENWESVKKLDVVKTKKTLNHSLNISPDAPIIIAVENEPVLKIIDVREHLRNLPQGHRPSGAKIAEAAQLGIELANNQTFVSGYPRSYVA